MKFLPKLMFRILNIIFGQYWLQFERNNTILMPKGVFLVKKIIMLLVILRYIFTTNHITMLVIFSFENC